MAAMPFSPCDPGQPTCDDVTVGILQHIFGPIIDVLVKGQDPNTVAAASNLLATLFTFFNSGILVVGSIIVSYVAVMGAVNTANDGEAMGKAWSTVWTPVRIVAGGAVLLPSTSGYSFIQMLVLMISLWSIGFANGIYKLGMGMGVLKPDGIVATSYQTGTYFGMRDFGKQYLAAAYCARAANTIYADAAGNPMVMANSAQADKQATTGTRTDYTFFIKDRNAATNLGAGEPICGTVTLTAYAPSGSYSDTSGTQAALDNMRAALMAQKLQAATGLMQDIDNWVATMPSDINQPGWDNVQSSQFNSIVKNREDQVVAAIANQMTANEGSVNTGVTAFVDGMTKEGWAMAGGWYQRVGLLRSKVSTITSESVGNVTTPSLSGLPADARSSLLKSSVTTVAETISKKSELAGNGYDASTSVKPEDMASMLPKDGTSDINVGSIDSSMSGWAIRFVNDMEHKAVDFAIGSGTNVDAVSRMKMTGDLLSSYQAMLWAADVSIKTAITATRVVVGAVGGVEILGNKADFRGVTDPLWDWIMAVPVPILAKLTSYVGYLAFYFGVALPSMPYTLFMITVVGWVLGVLQTTIAAPLWAIMHMRPSQTFVGSEAQGYLLLMALFVRPALAVIGLFAAMLVADPIVGYIAKAFFAMKGDVAASTGWVGVLAQFTQFFWWFTAFGGLLFPVLFMIFGLPQVLPDRVLAWLNVGVHDLGATGAGSSAQASLQAGAGRAQAETVQKLAGPGGGQGGPGGGPRRLGGGGGFAGGDGGSPRTAGRGAQPINANHQGVAPAVNEMGNPPAAPSGGGQPGGGPRRGVVGSALAAGARGQFGTRLAEGMGVALGRAVTDTGYAVKDAAAEGAGGFAGRLKDNMKDAVVTAGSEGAAAFREGADSRISNFKAGVALRSALQGAPAAAGAAALAMAAAGPAQASEAPTPPVASQQVSQDAGVASAQGALDNWRSHRASNGDYGGGGDGLVSASSSGFAGGGDSPTTDPSMPGGVVGAAQAAAQAGQAPGAAVLSQGSSTGPVGYDGGDDAALDSSASAQVDGGFVGGDAASDPVIDDANAALAQSSVQAPTTDIDIPQSLDEG